LDYLWNELDYSDSRTRRRNHVYGRAGKVFSCQEQPKVIEIRFGSDLGFVAAPDINNLAQLLELIIRRNRPEHERLSSRGLVQVMKMHQDFRRLAVFARLDENVRARAFHRPAEVYL